MKTLLYFTLPALAILAFAACNSSESAPGTTTPPPPVVQAPVSPKPEVYLYVAAVDQLNLREQPSKSSKVIHQFAEGTLVESTGEVSANKEEATLRGVPFNEPYFKVKPFTADAVYGWAYSAALKPIYSGPRNTMPDIAGLSRLSQFLKTLKTKQLESGKKALEYVQTNYGSVTGTTADAACLLLYQFLFRMEIEGDFYQITESFQWADDDYEAISDEKFDMNKYPLTKKLAENGFRLDVGEGMVFPIADWSKLTNMFASRATPPMKEYLIQKTEEQKNNMYDDGGIIIGLDTIANWALFWEKFNRQNPYFLLGAETQSSEHWMRGTLLHGADNTPAFDYETQAPTESFRKVWDDILKKYPGTTLAKDVKTLSDLLASEGGKRGKKTEEWLSNYINN